MRTDYLTAAANEIFALVAIPPVTQRKLASAALLSSDILNKLLDDKRFFEDLGRAAQDAFDEPGAFDQLTFDVDRFTDAFLHLEKELLLSAGLSPELVDAAGQRARELRQEIREWGRYGPRFSRKSRRGKWKAEEVRQRVIRLRDISTILARRIAARELSAETPECQKLLKRISCAVAGAAIVGINNGIGFSAWTPDPAIAKVFEGVSSIVGGVFIEKAMFSNPRTGLGSEATLEEMLATLRSKRTQP